LKGNRGARHHDGANGCSGAAWGLVPAAAQYGIKGMISFPNYFDVRKQWNINLFTGWRLMKDKDPFPAGLSLWNWIHHQGSNMGWGSCKHIQTAMTG